MACTQDAVVQPGKQDAGLGERASALVSTWSGYRGYSSHACEGQPQSWKVLAVKLQICSLEEEAQK
jgi:hypothetical protein